MCQIIINNQGFDTHWKKNFIFFFRTMADSGKFSRRYMEKEFPMVNFVLSEFLHMKPPPSQKKQHNCQT